jgi:hypothetical protein
MPRANGHRNGTTDPRVRYLPCRAEPGMFRGELLVYLDGFDPEKRKRITVQLLVDEHEVENLEGEPRRNKPARGWVRVTFAGQQGDFAAVILPQPAQPVGESLLVESNDLRTRAGA